MGQISIKIVSCVKKAYVHLLCPLIIQLQVYFQKKNMKTCVVKFSQIDIVYGHQLACYEKTIYNVMGNSMKRLSSEMMLWLFFSFWNFANFKQRMYNELVCA